MSDREVGMQNTVFSLETRIHELEAEVMALHQELATYRQDSGHIIELREDGWTIQHPLSCRPNLFDCIYNFAAAELALGVNHTPGRYQVTVEAGELILGNKI